MRRQSIAAGILMWFAVTTAIFCRSTDAIAGKPKFTVSKATTYLTGPLTKDGYVDYAAALNQRFGQGVTLKNNAAVLFWQAIGPAPDGERMSPRFFKMMGMAVPEDKGDYFVDFTTFLQQTIKLKPELERASDELYSAMSSMWTAKKFPHMAAWIKANEKPLKLIVAGTKRPMYFSPVVVPKKKLEIPSGLIDAMAPGAQQCRGFARALSARALWHLKFGRKKAAWQDVLACYRLGRLLGRGPSAIEALAGIAIDGIANTAGLVFLEHAQLSRADLTKALNELQGLPGLPVTADKVELWERMMFLDSIQIIAKDQERLLASFGRKIPPKARDAIDWDLVLKAGNQWYDRVVKPMRQTDPIKRRKEFDALNVETQKWIKSLKNFDTFRKKDIKTAVSKAITNVMLATFLPAVEQLQKVENRATQRWHNIQLAFALKIYRKDHGRYPPQLSDLTPKIVKAIPADVFSGKALIYRAKRDSYLLYSIGQNGRDEAGRNYDDEPMGDDLRLRMPSPEAEEVGLTSD